MSTVLEVSATPVRPLTFRLPAVVLFAGGYVGLVLFGQWLSLNPGHTSTVVLTSGLYIAVLLSSERTTWLKWAATVFALECLIVLGLFHESLTEALSDAASHAAGAYAGAHLIRACRGLPFRVENLRDVNVFFVGAALLGPAVSISVHFLLASASGHHFTGLDWMSYWTGDAAGAMVMAPLLLVLRQHAPRWRTVPPLKWLEAAVLYLLLALVLHIMFSLKLPTLYLALPLILWAAVRLGMPGTMVFMLVLMAFMVRYNALGLGPYGVLPLGRSLMVQSFLVVAAVSAMCLSAIFFSVSKGATGAAACA